MTNLSIIVPHYNSIHTLKRLISSIINEKKEDVEIIIVDDNSDCLDELRKLESEYASHISLLTNYTKMNSAGTCRNIGIENSKGMWLLFCDSDDYLIEGWYSVLSEFFDSTSDVILFKPASINEKSGLSTGREAPFIKLMDEYSKGIPGSELRIKYNWISPCSRMIRRDLIIRDNIRFESVMYGNDVLFSVKLGHSISSFELCDKPIYCITQSEGSLTSTKNKCALRERSKVAARRFCYIKSILDSSEIKRINIRRKMLQHILKSIKYGYFFEYLIYFHRIRKEKK